jgi:diadenylate cyclase
VSLINNLFDYFLFIFERLDWLSVLDILLVTIVFFFILYLLRDTKAMVLLRGILLLIVIVSLITNLRVLPAFSWLVTNTLPALLLAIPAIFAPEIRRALERLGRTGTVWTRSERTTDREEVIQAVTVAAKHISNRKYGGLIVFQRLDPLQEYIETGIEMNANVTPEILIQTFFPKTPLHDGAVIISEHKVVAAACVLPLSSSGVLDTSPERPMGLRHRAALGIAEASDAIAVVISEETGVISLAYEGEIIRYVPLAKLEDKLLDFFQPLRTEKSIRTFLQRMFSSL